MLRYMIRRLLWAIVLFLAVTIVSYVLFFIIPANPAKQACGQACTTVDVKRVAHVLHSTGRSTSSTATSSRTWSSTRILGRSYFNRAERQLARRRGRARHRVARLRRRRALDADRDPARHPLRAPAALALRPSVDDLRARSASPRTRSGSG